MHLDQKKEGMIRISDFDTNSLQLDEIASTCQESIDIQVKIQCYQEVCQDTRNSSMLQQFLKDSKKSNRASKSVWGVNKIDVGNDYKPGGTAIIAFGKTARRVTQQVLMT